MQPIDVDMVASDRIANDVTGPQRIAVLFADVCDSTQLYERLGDAEALAAMSRCLEMAREVAVRGGGRLVKTMGDELMLVFSRRLRKPPNPQSPSRKRYRASRASAGSGSTFASAFIWATRSSATATCSAIR